jgi:hypothetical protein
MIFKFFFEKAAGIQSQAEKLPVIHLNSTVKIFCIKK